jgi:hypothetical protein
MVAKTSSARETAPAVVNSPFLLIAKPLQPDYSETLARPSRDLRDRESAMEWIKTVRGTR